MDAFTIKGTNRSKNKWIAVDDFSSVIVTIRITNKFDYIGTSMGEFQRLDNELLNGYLDNLGKNIVQEMMDLYCQQSVIYLDEIKEAANVDSFEVWHTHCHKMKGAAGSVGLVEVHAKLVVIEKLELSVSEKLEQLAELKTLNDLAIDELNQWLVS